MKTFNTFMEDLASGRPMKKPVSSNLLKQRARENQKALDTGFMKLTPKERAKESKRMSEEKIGNFKDGSYYGKPSPRLKKKVKGAKEVVNNPHSKDDGKTVVAKQKQYNPPMSKSKQGVNNVLKFLKKNPDYKIGAHSLKKESARDNYNPVVSDKRTKEKLKKAGLPPESPKVNEEMEEQIRNFSEGKKKGMDGKACWKGYKLQGTKKKGNRTVDNCVPMSEEEEIKPHKMYKGDKVIMAKSTAEHEKLKKQGYTHDNPKTEKVEEEKKNCGCGQDPCITYGKKQMKEAKKPVVHSKKPDSLKTVKIKYNKPIGVKVTNIGPGGKETVVKNTMQEQQMQIVTNLDFNESLGNLVSRGLDKVRSSIKDAEKRTGLSVDASKNNKNNPVSGDNIRKRLASQKKR